MKGHFGVYGGQFVPETLMYPLEELEAAYKPLRRDPAFQARLEYLFHNYSGRPTPLYNAERLAAAWGCGKIYLKREDLNHTGAHKINNCLGQGLLAERMGKKRIIAETGAGQHGVATATVCALLGPRMRCLHGRRRHPPAGTQCLPHETARSARCSCFLRKQNSERCHQRSHARLGDERADDLLHAGFRARSASLSDNGARFSIRDWTRGSRPDPGEGRPAAGCARGLCRRR